MHSKGLALMETLAGIAAKHQKAYCYPSQRTILSLLGKFHGLGVSRRTLNRILADLEGCGYFRRVKRHYRSLYDGMVFRSTLFKLTGKFFKFFGFLARWPQKFAGVIRVPKMAQYIPFGEKVSAGNPGGPVDKSPAGQVEGGPVRAFSSNPEKSDPQRVGDLIKQALKSSL